MRTIMIIMIFSALLAGCANLKAEPPKTATVEAYDGNAVYHYALGRRYQAQGRYLLARESFLQALAMSRDEEFRNLVAGDIEATDKAIRSKR